MGEYHISGFEANGLDVMKEFLKRNLSPSTIEWFKFIRDYLVSVLLKFNYFYGKFFKTPFNLRKNSSKQDRKLEIGPGAKRIPGFETVNVVLNSDIDYVADATQKLPFEEGTFSVVYASHVLEHTAWFDMSKTLAEWVRVLCHGGVLEVWVPDGYKISKLLCDIEEGIERVEWDDGWRPFNPEGNPYKWVNGRILYGARLDYPSWHTAIITPKYLEELLNNLGLIDVERLSVNELGGVDHGWINLGFRGRKP